MASNISTPILLRAIADRLRPVTYQPYGYPEPIPIALKKSHPKTTADFTDKQVVAVLTDISVSPPKGHDRLSKVELQLTCWAIDSENAQYASDVLADVLRCIGCDLCMPGQGLAGNFVVNSIGGTSWNEGNDLYYRAVRFSGFVGTGACGKSAKGG